MAKRKKREAVSTTSSEPLNNPFAGLAGLRDQLASSSPIESESSVGVAQVGVDDRGRVIGPKVVVSREKKGRGGKTVTRVSGLGLAGPAVKDLAKSLQRALGCGATVDGEDVLLQGAQGERVQAELRARGAKRVIVAN